MKVALSISRMIVQISKLSVLQFSFWIVFFGPATPGLSGKKCVRELKGERKNYVYSDLSYNYEGDAGENRKDRYEIHTNNVSL